MQDATANEIAIAREASSRGAFRMVYAFSAFGFVDFLGALVMTIALLVLPPARMEEWSLIGGLGTPWGIADSVVLLAAAAIKLAMIVSLHRRRLTAPAPLRLWVGLGLVGIGARVGVAFLAYGQAASVARRFDSSVVIAWSSAVNATGQVRLLLDVAMGVAILAIAARGVQNDERPPERPADYRSAGRT